MSNNESQTEVANSNEGVVLTNQNLPGLGFLVNYAVYDGSVNLKHFVEYMYSVSDIDFDNAIAGEERYGDNNERKAAFQSRYQHLIPVPRHGGSAFSQAVRALTTKAQRVVYDNPDDPLSNNKERLRVARNGSWGYTVQWNIVPLRKNMEYALQRTRRGYIDGQPRLQVKTESLYRIRKAFPNTSFTRNWLRDYLGHVWEGTSMPSVEQLRNCVVLEPMEAEALPNDGRFMRRAQERLRDAFVTASMSIDDDKMRKTVRRTIVDMGGILPHGSSGGVYFIYDRNKRWQENLNRLSGVIDSFADTGNTSDRHAMWVERAAPWWATITGEDSEEIPISAHSTSGMRSLTYGSSQKQIDDIKRMYVATMQNAQAKYYRLVHQMLQNGEIDEDALATKRAEVMETLEKAQNDLGADTVALATEKYQEVVSGLTSRFESMWTPDERASQAEKERVANRIDTMLSLRLS